MIPRQDAENVNGENVKRGLKKGDCEVKTGRIQPTRAVEQLTHLVRRRKAANFGKEPHFRRGGDRPTKGGKRKFFEYKEGNRGDTGKRGYGISCDVGSHPRPKKEGEREPGVEEGESHSEKSQRERIYRMMSTTCFVLKIVSLRGDARLWGKLVEQEREEGGGGGKQGSPSAWRRFPNSLGCRNEMGRL